AGDPRAPGHPRAWARTRTSGNASHDPAQPAVEPPPMSTLSSFLCWVHGAPCRPDFFNSPLRPAVTHRTRKGTHSVRHVSSTVEPVATLQTHRRDQCYWRGRVEW